jgi:hypothetical protein
MNAATSAAEKRVLTYMRVHRTAAKSFDGSKVRSKDFPMA